MKKIRKRWLIILGMLLISALVLKISAENPLVIHNGDVPENYYTAIQNQAKGLYSSRLPLVPVFVSTDNFERDTVFYTIHCFPFGTVGMAYTEGDGYSTEKPLIR